MFCIGSITTLPYRSTSGPTGVLHASRLFELITIAQEPQIAERQEYRIVRDGSISSRILRRAVRTGVWGGRSSEYFA